MNRQTKLTLWMLTCCLLLTIIISPSLAKAQASSTGSTDTTSDTTTKKSKKKKKTDASDSADTADKSADSDTAAKTSKNPARARKRLLQMPLINLRRATTRCRPQQKQRSRARARRPLLPTTALRKRLRLTRLQRPVHRLLGLPTKKSKKIQGSRGRCARVSQHCSSCCHSCSICTCRTSA